jgi:hypothetical protein
MVRSAAICWKIGLAATALALPLWQLPARAEDETAEKVETRAQPVETKAVRVILLPPANDAAFRSWRPGRVDGGSIVMVRPAEDAVIAAPPPEQENATPIPASPAENAAIAQPRPEQTEAPAIRLRPAENAAIAERDPQQAKGSLLRLRPAEDAVIAERHPDPAKAAPLGTRPAENAAITERDPQQTKGALLRVRPAEDAEIPQSRPDRAEAAAIPAQPAGGPAIAQPRPEPEKSPEDATLVEAPSLPERRPRLALLPPAGDAPVASPRPETAKTQNDALVALPSLPERSPFRGGGFKSEIVENGPAIQRAAEPAPPKTAAGRFLANIWPGNKGASTPASSTVGGGPASAPAQGQPEAGPKPPIKRLLDGIQFWK